MNLTLTEQQVAQINRDMNERKEMLNDAEVNALAQKINKIVDLPFINEQKEFIAIVKIVKWVDQQLYKLLPNEYYELVKESSDGISREEAEQIEERLTPLINNLVNIPILSEKQEAKIISLVLGLIIRALIKGFKLEEVEPEK